MGFRVKWVVLALLLCVAGGPDRALGQLPKVRIGLVVGCTEVAFSGPAGVTIKDLRGERVVAWTPPDERWRAEGGAGRVRILGGGGEWSLARGVLLLPPEGGVVTVHGVPGHWDKIEDRSYRGVIELMSARGGALTVVNVVEVETYLRGVVPSEMPPKYPLEALKAQAVAARGQALTKAGRHRSEGFDLCAGPHCQVYGGATSEDRRSDQAVAETWGEVLEYGGVLADTLYSSNCGGHTANNEDYWPGQRPVPYLRGAPDFDEQELGLEFPLSEEELREYLKYAPPVYCNQPRYAKASKFRWWEVVPRERLAAALKRELGDFGELLDVRVTRRADSGMVTEVAVVGSRRMHKPRGGAQIRRTLGGLNSATFAVEPVREGDSPPVAFVIWGAGWGHQVGMCQVGAAGLADRGANYRRILRRYYRGCKVTRRY